MSTGTSGQVRSRRIELGPGVGAGRNRLLFKTDNPVFDRHPRREHGTHCMGPLSQSLEVYTHCSDLCDDMPGHACPLGIFTQTFSVEWRPSVMVERWPSESYAPSLTLCEHDFIGKSSLCRVSW